ncbi:MAG TPA: hypothetical protein VG944_08810 [Fimbriimonas sp.]|nr:hypothetical protein [Fimbriimonas sp.]
MAKRLLLLSLAAFVLAACGSDKPVPTKPTFSAKDNAAMSASLKAESARYHINVGP